MKDTYRDIAGDALGLADAYCGGDSETLRQLNERFEALESAPKPRKKRPFVLVTVSGGVASVWCPRGVEYDIIDWDNYERGPPTQNDLVQMREIAGFLQNKADRKFLLDQIQELEDRSVADED